MAPRNKSDEPEVPDSGKYVFMTHSSSPDADPAPTTVEAFDEVWKDKGWKLVKDSETLNIPPSPPPAA